MSPAASTSDRKGVDPLQSMDPWQAALDKSSTLRTHHVGLPLASDAARQIEQSVLHKLKAAAPDGTSAESMQASIMARVESRLASSHGELDSRINALDAKVGHVAQKVDSQEGLLQSLFAEQMSRIEELIGSTKKPRAE